MNGVATDFNRRDVPGPLGTFWGDSGLRMILRDKALLGHVTHSDVSVLGDDGMPISCAEPLITQGDWDVLQRALARLSQTHVRSETPSMLLNVAECSKCGGPLYLYSKHNIVTLASGERRRRGPFAYYRCRNSSAAASRPKTCDAKMISCKALNDWVDLWFTGEAFGQTEIIERVTVPGANHAAGMAAVNAAIHDLTAQFTSEAIPEADFDAKLTTCAPSAGGCTTCHQNPTRYKNGPQASRSLSTGRPSTRQGSDATCSRRARRYMSPATTTATSTRG